MKGRVAGFVWRLIGPMLQQQVTFNAALLEHLEQQRQSDTEVRRALSEVVGTLAPAVDALATFESRVVQFAQRITPLVDARVRLVEDSIAELQMVTAVTQRASVATQRALERLTERQPQDDRPGAGGPGVSIAAVENTSTGLGSASHTYVGFEDQFRGSEAEIRERVSEYVRHFGGASNVLDVGCGRGEFLDLLAAQGIGARGIDVNEAMVDVCRARGHDVTRADAVEYITALSDDSLGGMIAVQVVEHFEPGYLMRFIQLAQQKLRPGAALVLETINPTCWTAFFESYIRDLTHVRPIHPETLRYLLLAAGFRDIELLYRSPVADRLQSVSGPPAIPGVSAGPLGELVTAFNRNVERLNARMFGYLDYAAIGRRA